MTNASHAGYSIRIWGTEDGLPQNTVTAIAQTNDGYIWVATLAGLARFDGERFETFDASNTPELGDGRISSLFVDRRGVLWIGQNSGNLTRYETGRFECLAEVEATESVTAIGDDANGAIWLMRANAALERLDGSRPRGGYERGAPAAVVRFAENTVGEIYLAVDGEVSRLAGGELQPLDLGAAEVSGYVRGLARANDGGVWINRDGWIRKWKDGRWTEARGAWNANESNAMIELRDGTLAVGTMDAGFHLLAPDGGRLNLNYGNVLIQNWVKYFFEDREGNLWLASGSGGLVAVRRTGFTVVDSPDHWGGRTVLSVAPAAEAGALWIGTEGNGVYRYDGEKWAHYGEQQGLLNGFVWALAVDDLGRLWVGTWGGGIFRLEGDRFVTIDEPGTASAAILFLRFDPVDRALWVGTRTGVMRVASGASTWPLRDEVVCAMVRDEKGVAWFALPEAGLARLDGGNVTHFGKRDGLPSNAAQCLLADGDVLWIGTPDGGLSRWKDGRFSTIGLAQGLPSKAVCHIADDGQGFLWLSTHHGIVRVSKAELNRCAHGEVATISGQVYDKNDGLPTIEYSGGLQAAGCQMQDGRLWFPSPKGVVSVDPRAIRLNTLPPPVAIEALRVNGQPVEAASRGTTELRLPPNHQRLEFQFTALSLAASGKSLFKYRLHGLDTDWIDAGTKRTAFYSQLPPGAYRFQVIACNNDRVWNTEGVTREFAVLPFYWQTWWFRGLAGLLGVSAVSWGARHVTRQRMQRRVEELEYERGIERERARIAQDIHDDIGSSLTRITMLSQSVRGEADDPYRAAAVLERIHDTALEVTHTLDEIVWAVNPRHDTLDSLACYLARYAQERLGEAGVVCRLHLPLQLPQSPLSTQVRHNLLLAFKEALNNVLKHSAATEVQVSLTLRTDEFAVAVRDNGRGFGRALGAAVNGVEAERFCGGNGLGNLRRRLVQIGGRCEIVSEPGKGSCISFIVKLPTTAPSTA